MADNTTVLAIYVGKKGGEVAAVTLKRNKLSVAHTHRFENRPVYAQDRYYWNVLSLWEQIQHGIDVAMNDGQPSAIGVCGWSDDFVLLDARGDLMGNPFYVQNRPLEEKIRAAYSSAAGDMHFGSSGVRLTPDSALSKLIDMTRSESERPASADLLLTISDLFNYWLTGNAVAEYTAATTTQGYNLIDRGWLTEMLEREQISVRILPSVIETGSLLGSYYGVKVFAAPGSVMASALAALPLAQNNYAFVYVGQHGLVGVDAEAPATSEQALALGLLNEGAVGGRTLTYRRQPGLSLIERFGASSQLCKKAAQAQPFKALLDFDQPVFNGDQLSELVAAFSQETGQAAPEDDAQVLRCLLESNAFKVRSSLERITDVTGREIQGIYLVADQQPPDALFSQMLANATNLPVVTISEELPLVGSALVQMVSLGKIASLADGQALIAESVPMTQYEPNEPASWTEAYNRFRMVLAQSGRIALR